MTPKVARFLVEHQPATPCLVLDVDRVEANFRTLQRALPLARPPHSLHDGSAAMPRWPQESPLPFRIEIAAGDSARVDCAANASRVV